jgi:hypothetical protein
VVFVDDLNQNRNDDELMGSKSLQEGIESVYICMYEVWYTVVDLSTANSRNFRGKSIQAKPRGVISNRHFRRELRLAREHLPAAALGLDHRISPNLFLSSPTTLSGPVSSFSPDIFRITVNIDLI